MALKKIGALWIRQGKKGKFLSGELQLEGRDGPKISVLVFKETDKKNQKGPDYTINQSDDEPRKERAIDDDGPVPF